MEIRDISKHLYHVLFFMASFLESRSGMDGRSAGWRASVANERPGGGIGPDTAINQGC
jgi:hypothetical protein